MKSIVQVIIIILLTRVPRVNLHYCTRPVPVNPLIPLQTFASQEMSAATSQQTAFVVGYTGEVGKQLVAALLKEHTFKQLYLIGRRQVDNDAFDSSVVSALVLLLWILKVQKQVDFDNLDESVLAGADVGFCCLGTTRGKSGKDGFIKVDHDYTMAVAQAARKVGVSTFGLVSSMGANANSMMLYPQTKGQVENEIKELGFTRFFVYRPGFLLCDRTEQRIGEKIAHAFVRPLAYLSPTKMSIPTELVAKAMIASLSEANVSGQVIYENAKLHELAKKNEGN